MPNCKGFQVEGGGGVSYARDGAYYDETTGEEVGVGKVRVARQEEVEFDQGMVVLDKKRATRSPSNGGGSAR